MFSKNNSQTRIFLTPDKNSYIKVASFLNEEFKKIKLLRVIEKKNN